MKLCQYVPINPPKTILCHKTDTIFVQKPSGTKLEYRHIELNILKEQNKYNYE